MKTPTSRYRQPQKHTFAGEAEAKSLMQWLNSKDGGQPRKDVAEALTLFRSVLEGMEASGKKTLFEAMRAYPDAAVKSQLAHGLLAKYTFRPSLRPQPGAETSFRWLPAWEQADAFIIKERLGGYGPAQAVLGIMRLCEKGLVSRVKQCSCGKWIFARLPQERHCSGKCRVAAHRAKPEFAERRREWRRSNRRVHEVLESGGRRAHAKKR